MKERKVNVKECQVCEVVIEHGYVGKHCRYGGHALLERNRQEVDAQEVGDTCTQQLEPSHKSNTLERHSTINYVLKNHQKSAQKATNYAQVE